MTSLSSLKFLPGRLGLLRIGAGWRFLFSIAVMAAYMAASRAIYHLDGLSFAEVELLRTPFRLVGALLFWLLMFDVIFARDPDIGSLRQPRAVYGICLGFAVPLLAMGQMRTGSDAVIIAVASVPVALNEELFFRGILQTILVRHFGALRGIGLATVAFVLFHVGVGPQDANDFSFIALAGLMLGLVYFKTGSIVAVVVIHAVYDALSTALEGPILSRPWGIILLLCSSALLLKWATARTERDAVLSL